MLRAVRQEAAQVLAVQRRYDRIWAAHFADLRAFRKKHGNCRVPSDWPKNQALAKWVEHQRTYRRRGTLAPERLSRLERIGFCWDAMKGPARLHSNWDARFAELVAYKKRFGHCRTLSSDPTHYRLHRWVLAQRSAYYRGELPRYRFEKLDRLGFAWKTRKRRPRELSRTDKAPSLY